VKWKAEARSRTRELQFQKHAVNIMQLLTSQRAKLDQVMGPGTRRDLTMPGDNCLIIWPLPNSSIEVCAKYRHIR